MSWLPLFAPPRRTLFTIIFLCSLVKFSEAGTTPNILFFLGDDIGWNDVGWNNKEMVTPTLDQLAKDGIILDDYYTHTVCTPSRSSLMTGYYAHSIGLQRGVLTNQEASGVPLRYKLLPKKLKEVGYVTHGLGKWHLGYCNRSYTPMARGFDSFLGFYTGAEENYLHCSGNSLAIKNDTCIGLDFHENGISAPQYNGQFSSDIYTEHAMKLIKEHDKTKPFFMYISMTNMHFPVQSPERYAAKCSSHKNPARKSFCAAMAAHDDAVSNVTTALKESGLYENTIIIFASDNGAWTMFGGNNYPLRGEKSTLWEGGCRVPAFIHSPLLTNSKYVRKGLFHVSDWYPTILGIINATQEDEFDGLDQWHALKYKEESPRLEVVYSIDKKEDILIGAIRVGDLKLTTGPPGNSAKRVTEQQTTDISFDQPAADDVMYKYFHDPLNKTDAFVRLFNLTADPFEEYNLAGQNPELVNPLLNRLKFLAEKAKPPFDPMMINPAGDPALRGGVYEPGWCQALDEFPGSPGMFE